ncbi:MAG TPA: hypothetical protein VG317_04880 [Pseudonocardiaceae bacterium]|nr:hypothetical protein [Pseudonocardiaceae bacterium]
MNTIHSRRVRTLGITGALIGAAAAVTLVAAPGANAATGHTTVLTAPLTAHQVVRAVPNGAAENLLLDDGRTITVSAQQYQVVRTGSADRARPNGSVQGDCGESYIYIDDLGGGTAEFNTGAESYLGPIAYGSATVGWSNADTGANNTFNLPVTANNGASAWDAFTDDNTGAGTVSADLSGDVVIDSGTVCTIDYPTDTEGVS